MRSCRKLSVWKWVVIFLGGVVGLYGVVMGGVWLLTFHPGEVQGEVVYNKGDVPLLRVGQEVKVMTWNVQYMAGKNYIFFYDMLDGSGPHTGPTAQDVAATFREVVRVIRESDPDVILLQEVDCGAKRTYYEDQLKVLMNLLPEEYKSYCSTYYWKNLFNPHPKIMGSTGLKLAIISKYKIEEAERYQLPCVEWTSIFKDFSFKRAILKARMPVEGGRDFFAINTHLSAFSKGTDNMKKQVEKVASVLEGLEKNRNTWIIGGDFNLLPPGQYAQLAEEAKWHYGVETELTGLTEKYACVPRMEDCIGAECGKWFTHFSNDPQFSGPDRTLDYIFHSGYLGEPLLYRVLNENTLHISDHLPLVSSFRILE